MKDRHKYKKLNAEKTIVSDNPVEVKNVLREVVSNMLGLKPDCSDEEMLEASKGGYNAKTDNSKSR